MLPPRKKQINGLTPAAPAPSTTPAPAKNWALAVPILGRASCGASFATSNPPRIGKVIAQFRITCVKACYRQLLLERPSSGSNSGRGTFSEAPTTRTSDCELPAARHFPLPMQRVSVQPKDMTTSLDRRVFAIEAAPACWAAGAGPSNRVAVLEDLAKNQISGARFLSMGYYAQRFTNPLVTTRMPSSRESNLWVRISLASRRLLAARSLSPVSSIHS